MKIDFYNTGVTQDLVLNFSLYLVIFLNGTCLSWSQEDFGMMHQRYWSDVLMCDASLLRSSLK